MNKKKIIRFTLIGVTSAVLVALAIGYYMFNKPHRNVSATDSDFQISAGDLVNEYLQNQKIANQKYLAEDGESKILTVTGKISSITTDLNNQRVVTLQEESQRAGVSCTFTASTNQQADLLAPGQTVTIKGVIRSGAAYDADLDLYEDVILEKCSTHN